ncbi:hypothetical protein ACT2FY_38475 [Paraburkholderia fungorum]|uniref:hypothetical protein n=1 Tax=Paraburkholderia fungorum TaxID=134537 RepID=UPI00402B46B0
MPTILVERARSNGAQLERTKARLGKRGSPEPPDLGTCPLCSQQQLAARNCTLEIIRSLNDGKGKSDESRARDLCFPHLLSLLVEDRLSLAQRANITGAYRARLSALMGSATYEQKLATHKRLPDPAIVNAVLRELAGHHVAAATPRPGASSLPVPPADDPCGPVTSSSVSPDCPVCLRLCDAWRSRLAMLDGNFEWQQDLYDLMPTASQNVWAMCDQAHNTGLRDSIATSGAYRMLAELDYLMLNNRLAGLALPMSGIRPYVHAFLQRQRARRTFLASCRHPFTCPVDRYIRGVEQHQLSRLISTLRDSDLSIAYRRTQGLCMVHLCSALSFAPALEIGQVLLETALDRNRQVLAQLEALSRIPPSCQPSSSAVVAPVGCESASLFFSGVDHRHGTTQ